MASASSFMDDTCTRVIKDEYSFLEQIGSGSFAMVWKATRKKDGLVVAVKEINTDKLNKKLRESLESEIAILQSTQHPNIIQLYDIFKAAGRVFLVTEYCGGGDLALYIKRHGGVKEPTARYFMEQLGAGLKVLRVQNLIHRDLKPHNLLLTADSSTAILKIADFGFARSMLGADLAETLCGSPLYMAPEILQFQKYDAKADLWSVGTILFELLTGHPPFGGTNHVMLLRNIERTEARLPDAVAAVLSSDCKSLLKHLLRRNPVERLSFVEFFSHPFMLPGGGERSRSNSRGSSADRNRAARLGGMGPDSVTTLSGETSGATGSGSGRNSRDENEDSLPFLFEVDSCPASPESSRAPSRHSPVAYTRNRHHASPDPKPQTPSPNYHLPSNNPPPVPSPIFRMHPPSSKNPPDLQATTHPRQQTSKLKQPVDAQPGCSSPSSRASPHSRGGGLDQAGTSSNNNEKHNRNNTTTGPGGPSVGTLAFLSRSRDGDVSPADSTDSLTETCEGFMMINVEADEKSNRGGDDRSPQWPSAANRGAALRANPSATRGPFGLEQGTFSPSSGPFSPSSENKGRLVPSMQVKLQVKLQVKAQEPQQTQAPRPNPSCIQTPQTPSQTPSQAPQTPSQRWRPGPIPTFVAATTVGVPAQVQDAHHPSEDVAVRTIALERCAEVVGEVAEGHFEENRPLAALSLHLLQLRVLQSALKFAPTVAVRGTVEQSFAAVVDKAEEVRSALESDRWETGGEEDDVAVPDALELSFQAALLFGRGGACEELVGNVDEAAVAYSKACCLLYFLAVEAPHVAAIAPPLLLGPTDTLRLRRYALSIGARHVLLCRTT